MPFLFFTNILSRYAKRPNHESFNEMMTRKKYGGEINMVNGVELGKKAPSTLEAK